MKWKWIKYNFIDAHQYLMGLCHFLGILTKFERSTIELLIFNNTLVISIYHLLYTLHFTLCWYSSPNLSSSPVRPSCLSIQCKGIQPSLNKMNLNFVCCTCTSASSQMHRSINSFLVDEKAYQLRRNAFIQWKMEKSIEWRIKMA